MTSPSAVRGDAVLSSCGRYRYRLTRQWSTEAPPATFVMLNPSTADASVNDRTIVRCMGFARSWGFGGLAVVNLYGFRATRPEDLWRAEDPVGPENDAFLQQAVEEARADGTPVVAAWGAHARRERVEAFMSWAGPVHALATTKAGQPRHPLYLPATAELSRWDLP